jgi:signal transduction histidine kinase
MNELVLLWVRDLGPGISPIHQEQIFEKFVRLQPQEKPRGLGLGLAYCRLAVQAHGGEIWVESQPGEGACFKLTLPIISKDKSNEPYAAGKRDDIRR